jgi:hypothetical protein
MAKISITTRDGELVELFDLDDEEMQDWKDAADHPVVRQDIAESIVKALRIAWGKENT